MKKLLVLTIVTALLLTLFVSCQNSDTPPADDPPSGGDITEQPNDPSNPDTPSTPGGGDQDDTHGDKEDESDKESSDAFKGNDGLTELCVLSSESAKVTAENTDNAIKVKLTPDSVSGIHTVRVPVDEGWDTVKVVQGKSTTYVKVYTKNGISLVDFSMLSESDDAVITPALTKNEEKLESEFGMTLENGTKIDTNYFPGFVRKSVTFTLDDGVFQADKKVVDMLNPYGFTGTFNINNPNTVTDPTIYDGFEVANHHILHAVAVKPAYAEREFVNEYLPKDADTSKVYLASRTVNGEQVDGMYYVYIGSSWHPMAADETYIKYLEWTTKELDKMFGEGTVVGFAYPHGNQYNDAIIAYLKEAGYLYGRRTGNLKASTGFALPTDRYTWTYNADHNCLLEVMADYEEYEDDGTLKMFSFGVHSNDFEAYNKWGDLETFAKTYGNRQSEFWYATNRQIFEYEDAIDSLEISEEKIVNSSDIAVFITVNGEKVIIPANSVYYLDGNVKIEITFDPDNGTSSKTKEANIASLIAIPTSIPVKNGFTFDGWYVDGVKWNFNDRATKSMTLKAHYTPEPFKGATAEVLPVKGGAGGIVSIIHDDGRSPSGYILDELFYKYNLVGDVALLTSNVYNPSTGAVKPEYNKWKSIIDTGRWGIINHSMTHTWWGNVTKDANGNNIKWDEDADKMYVETVGAQEVLRKLFPGHRALTYAYPGFAAECKGLTKEQTFEIIFGQNARDLIDQHFISARYAGENAPAYVDRDSDWIFLDGFFLSPGNINGTGSNSILNRLESAANDGRIHMFSMHAVSDEVEPGTSGYTLSSVDVENALKLIAKYVEEGKVWNTHYEDAILYVREAQNATVTASGDKNGITVILTDTMNDDVYNYPLTVRITVPGEWEAVKITQGKNVTYAVAKYLDGKWCIDADIVPDGGEAALTGISKKDIPYTPAKVPAPPASSVLPEAPVTPPDSLLDKEVTVGFETDPGVTAGEYLVKEFVTRDDNKALRIADDDPQNGGTATIPLGKSVTVEAFSFSFDINVKNATSFATTLYFADSNKTPYMLKLAASGSGYYLGDCQSNNGAGVQTNNLTGTTPLEFNKWYTIRIDVIFPSVDDFKAVWYVDGVKTGESTNRANYTKTSDAPLQNVVSKFAMTTLSTAKLDMQLDNLVMKAGTAAKLGLDGSSILVGTSFENNSATVKTADETIVKAEVVSRESGSDDKVLKMTKTVEGNTSVSISGTSSITNAKEFNVEFDIMLESSSTGTVAQIFFNTSIEKSPLDLTLHGSESGIYFRSLNSYSGGTSYKFGDKDTYLAYNKYHHVKLHVVIGDANTFVATLYLNGENVGSTNVFLNPQKVEGYHPSKALNTVQFTWQKTSRVVGYIDNVSLVVK